MAWMGNKCSKKPGKKYNKKMRIIKKKNFQKLTFKAL